MDKKQIEAEILQLELDIRKLEDRITQEKLLCDEKKALLSRDKELIEILES